MRSDADGGLLGLFRGRRALRKSRAKVEEAIRALEASAQLQEKAERSLSARALEDELGGPSPRNPSEPDSG